MISDVPTNPTQSWGGRTLLTVRATPGLAPVSEPLVQEIVVVDAL